MDSAGRFEFLADLYERTDRAADAVCAAKGLDRDNYAPRVFVYDLLELAVRAGELAASSNSGIKTRLNPLVKKLEKVKGETTPSAKPIHKMTMEEFLKLIAPGENK
ncbi:MAG: hypothetical protein LBB23_04280 [Rickettsiales bacterium]|jgi:hypothetical protein|nr:hypothetical protein [Rickettsiales bacterium]